LSTIRLRIEVDAVGDSDEHTAVAPILFTA
jgi:hypothetical protein